MLVKVGPELIIYLWGNMHNVICIGWLLLLFVLSRIMPASEVTHMTNTSPIIHSHRSLNLSLNLHLMRPISYLTMKQLYQILWRYKKLQIHVSFCFTTIQSTTVSAHQNRCKSFQTWIVDLKYIMLWRVIKINTQLDSVVNITTPKAQNWHRKSIVTRLIFLQDTELVHKLLGAAK